MPWAGNKRTEFKIFKDYIDYDNKKNIIEPFCGSCAMSFNIWLEHGNKFNYYLNDLDEKIIKYHDIIKTNGTDFLLDNINKLIEKPLTIDKYKKLYKDYITDNETYKFFIILKLSYRSGCNTLRNSCHNLNKDYKATKKQYKFEEFLKSPNVYITNDDWKDCYNRHKDDKESIILFDPPYIDSWNNYYDKNICSLNVYDNINDIKNDKAKIYFIIEKIDKIEMIFKDWNILIEYDKTYQIYKRKTKHILYSN